VSAQGAHESRHQTGAGAGTWRLFVGRGGERHERAPAAVAASGGHLGASGVGAGVRPVCSSPQAKRPGPLI